MVPEHMIMLSKVMMVTMMMLMIMSTFLATWTRSPQKLSSLALAMAVGEPIVRGLQDEWWSMKETLKKKQQNCWWWKWTKMTPATCHGGGGGLSWDSWSACPHLLSGHLVCCSTRLSSIFQCPEKCGIAMCYQSPGRLITQIIGIDYHRDYHRWDEEFVTWI